MGQRLSTVMYSACWAGVRWLPERIGRWIFARVADCAWYRRGRRVRQLEANLGRIPDPRAGDAHLRALSRAGMRSYLRYWYEAFRLPALGRDQINARTACVGIEALEARIAAGRGVVAALPHMGNWDHAGAWITLRGTPLTTVAERLEPERLFERFVAFREGLGMEVLPLNGGYGTTFGTLARRLRAGGLVCLLADRDLTGQGVDVSLFGETARMPTGPAALALSTGAALMPVTLWFERSVMGIRIHDEIPVPAEGDRDTRIRAMTQELARAFETEIREHPQDWHMLQRVFVADVERHAPEEPAVAPQRPPVRRSTHRDPPPGKR